jgi:hypothetical protein
MTKRELWKLYEALERIEAKLSRAHVGTFWDGEFVSKEGVGFLRRAVLDAAEDRVLADA